MVGGGFINLLMFTPTWGKFGSLKDFFDDDGGGVGWQPTASIGFHLTIPCCSPQGLQTRSPPTCTGNRKNHNNHHHHHHHHLSHRNHMNHIYVYNFIYE